MSNSSTPSPLGHTPPPLTHHQVLIEFDVLAGSADAAAYLVGETLIEDLAGPPEQLRSDGDRVFGEDFGHDEEVPCIRSWIPVAHPVLASPKTVIVPSLEWLPFEGSGIPEVVAEMFPPEPVQNSYLQSDGTVDMDAFDDAHELWRDVSLSLAARAAQLPDLLKRLDRAERVRDELIDLLQRDPLPVEPVKDDYLVTVGPASEGEYDSLRFRRDHVQWQAEFIEAARTRDTRLHAVTTGSGPQSISVSAGDALARAQANGVAGRHRALPSLRDLLSNRAAQLVAAADPDRNVPPVVPEHGIDR